jgi:rhodanese-related sulfurtransferase
MLLNLGRAVTVDVRPPEYYANGHIPGAISAPLRELRQHLASLPRDKTIVFY